MHSVAVRVENLSKYYRLGAKQKSHDTLTSAIASWLKTPYTNFKRLQEMVRFDNSTAPDMIRALDDVSFDVPDGQVLGIIGRNGAGKSTLLKIISRITAPTTGRVIIEGRVSSLLEVGTGFHKDLTGRENVYLNGTILGMSKIEIDKKFDEIVAFSEVEKFIDTPIKFYSSGMKVRLAFSIAAHLEPEILIVDEVLAVGDVGFQKKCIGKMGEAGKKGRTVLFVSHNMSAVSNLCERVILLQNGHIKGDGVPLDIIAQYLKNDPLADPDALLPDDHRRGYGLVRLSGDLNVYCGDRISFRFQAVCPRSHSNAAAAVIVHDVFENAVFGAASRLQHVFGEGDSTRWEVECDLGHIPLTSGLYHVTIIFGNQDRNYAKFTKAFNINVLPSNWGNIPKIWGSLYWNPTWDFQPLKEGAGEQIEMDERPLSEAAKNAEKAGTSL